MRSADTIGLPLKRHAQVLMVFDAEIRAQELVAERVYLPTQWRQQ